MRIANKGQLSPFSFVVFYIVVLTLTIVLMSGTGMTGVSGDTDYSVNCPDAVNCGVSFYDNILQLLSFQSDLWLFNIALGMAYLILLIAIISIILGG